MRHRLIPLIALLLVLAAGLASRYGLSGWWAKYLGVALWATEAYALVLLLRPALSVRRAAMAALAISWGVELLQLTGLSAWLSARHLLLRLAFGTTFSWYDLPAYAAGVALGAAAHWWLLRTRCSPARSADAGPRSAAGR